MKILLGSILVAIGAMIALLFGLCAGFLVLFESGHSTIANNAGIFLTFVAGIAMVAGGIWLIVRGARERDRGDGP